MAISIAAKVGRCAAAPPGSCTALRRGDAPASGLDSAALRRAAPPGAEVLGGIRLELDARRVVERANDRERGHGVTSGNEPAQGSVAPGLALPRRRPDAAQQQRRNALGFGAHEPPREDDGGDRSEAQ